MTLNDFRQSGYIIWDMANKTITDNPQANGGDANGRTLKVLVKNAGTFVDLTGFDLNLGWKTSDGVHFGLDAFTAIDATQGLFEIYYTSGMLSNSGMLGAALQLVNAEGILESVAFKITVSPSIIDPLAVQSENTFTALATALVTVNGWNDRIDAVEADFIQRAIDMEAAYPQEIISLGQQLEQKATIDYVNTQVVTIPKGDKGDMGSISLVDGTLTSIIDTTANIFNPYKVLLGHLDYATGLVTESATEYTTDFLPAFPDKYIAAINGAWISFYDVNKVYISGYANLTYSSSRKFPTTAKHYKLGIPLTNYPTMCIKLSNTAFVSPITFEPYELTIDGFKVQDINLGDEAINKVVSEINGGKELIISDADWKNILVNGNLRTLTGAAPAYWSLLDLTVNQLAEKAQLVIDTPNLYPSLNSFFTHNFLSTHKYAFFYDFDIVSTNATEFDIGISVRLSDGTISLDYILKTLIPSTTKQQGVILFTVPTISNARVLINFRNFDGVPVGENKKLTVDVNGFMVLDLGDSASHTYGYTIPEILAGVTARGGYAANLLNNYLGARYADKSGISKYSEFVKSTFAGKKFVSFGDSITAQNKWQPYVIEKLGFGTHVNCGIGGTSVSVRDNGGVSYNADSFFQDARINTIPNDADLITVMGGFNDFNQFTQIGGTMPTLDSTTFKGALSLTVEKILSKVGMNPYVRVVLMTEPYGYTDPAPSRANVTLKQIVDAIKEVGQFYGLPVIDLYGLCGWNYVNRNTFLGADSVHFNDEGGKRIASIVTGKLREIEPYV